MPKGVEEGILRGIYKFSTKKAGAKRPTVQLFGSGAILREALKAQTILAEQFDVSSNVWSVTSYTELARDAIAAERHNMLHPTAKRRESYLEQVLSGEPGPIISASDYVRALAEQISPFVPGGGLFALGTDGFGRSETRSALRRHFEVDAGSIAVAALFELSKQGQVETKCVAQAIKKLGIDPEKVNPLRA
jgi:pyruvate dehydrogenase E1 component